MYERLRIICKQHNMTISQLCAQVTGSSGNLATWKKGYMRSDYLSKCADILGCTTDYILGRTNNANICKQKQDTPAPARDKFYRNETFDQLDHEMLRRFQQLSFDKKIEVINLTLRLSRSKSKLEPV